MGEENPHEGQVMPITVAAIYKNGVLEPVGELPLKEGEAVRITVRTAEDLVREGHGLIGWRGSHEELHAFLNDVDELYGTPEDWLGPRHPEERP
jgi:predicted DNA-binding antitoxin AbrB/MazE fold protein